MGNNKLVRQLLVPLATLLTLIVNIGINVVRFNGVTTQQVSDSFVNFFVPAGYVFSIWGVIYVGLIAYTVFQALPAQLGNARLAAVAPIYLLASAANILWLGFFHLYQFGLAMLMIVTLLLCLVGIYLRLGTGKSRVPRAETWLARVPFSIYLGWATVATIANATQLLVFLNWDGFGIAPQTWAVIMIATAVVVAVLMFLTRRDAAFLFVLAWALAGIGVKQAAVPAVSTPAWLATVVVALMAIVAIFWRPRPPATATT